MSSSSTLRRFTAPTRWNGLSLGLWGAVAGVVMIALGFVFIFQPSLVVGAPIIIYGLIGPSVVLLSWSFMTGVPPLVLAGDLIGRARRGRAAYTHTPLEAARGYVRLQQAPYFQQTAQTEWTLDDPEDLA